MIVLACTSIICTVLVLKLFYHNDRRPVPRWLHYTTSKLSRAVLYKLKSRRFNELPFGVDPGAAEQRLPRESGDESEGSDDVIETSNGNKTRCRACTAQHSRKDGPLGNDTAVDIKVSLRGPNDKKTHYVGTDLDWKDVALVIDRVALALSVTVTISSLIITVVLFLLG